MKPILLLLFITFTLLLTLGIRDLLPEWQETIVWLLVIGAVGLAIGLLVYYWPL